MITIRRTTARAGLLAWSILLLTGAGGSASSAAAGRDATATTGATAGFDHSGGLPLEPAVSGALHAPDVRTRDLRPLLSRGDSSYENATLTEDVTWRGTVLVRGSLVVAPQATLRIEAGTVVRFMKSPIMRQAPRLVVMGRLQCNGTAEKPVLFAPNLAEAAGGDWGGILLLSSEKRNQLDNVRIEGAETGIEARFSTLFVKGGRLLGNNTGMLLCDSTATLSDVTVTGAEAGLEARDSEIDMKNGVLESNRRGLVASHSALALSAVAVRDSAEAGITADECRIRLTGCRLTGNNGGARIRGGEGQILRTRFERNRGTALKLAGARLKIQHCLFSDTVGDAVRMEDGRSVIWGSAFLGNGGYNLKNSGREEISAVQNWWGSDRESAILATLHQGDGSGRITVSPWLPEKPVALP